MIKKMKLNRILLIATIVATMSTLNINAQQKSTTSTKSTSKTKPVLVKCHLSVDKEISNKVTLVDALAWADFTPLQVIGNDKKTYLLQQFSFTLISMNPLQTQEFGIGNAGIPFLARKAMDTMKTGDTIFLKEVTAKDDKGIELKISNILFSIK